MNYLNSTFPRGPTVSSRTGTSTTLRPTLRIFLHRAVGSLHAATTSVVLIIPSGPRNMLSRNPDVATYCRFVLTSLISCLKRHDYCTITPQCSRFPPETGVCGAFVSQGRRQLSSIEPLREIISTVVHFGVIVWTQLAVNYFCCPQRSLLRRSYAVQVQNSGCLNVIRFVLPSETRHHPAALMSSD